MTGTDYCDDNSALHNPFSIIERHLLGRLNYRGMSNDKETATSKEKTIPTFAIAGKELRLSII